MVICFINLCHQVLAYSTEENLSIGLSRQFWDFFKLIFYLFVDF